MHLFLDRYKAARRVSTPLMVILTPDPADTMARLASLSGEKPVYRWDIIRGLFNIAANQDVPGHENPVDMLEYAVSLPQESVVFMQNAQHYACKEDVAQAVWNLRDKFKHDHRTLVMLAPDMTLPPELAKDVLVLEQPLPGPADLLHLINDVVSAAYPDKEGYPAEGVDPDAVSDALAGLPAFAAEQSLAMALTKTGVDMPLLWENKRQVVQQTPGLSFTYGGESLDKVQGLDSIKTFTRRLFDGPHKPRCIVRLDEIEKTLGAGLSDTSGVSQDALGVLLRAMEDYDWRGMIAMGFPGTGKSMLSKAMGAYGGVPTIEADLGAAKGSLVGQSEGMVRTLIKTLHAIAGRDCFFIGTCNRMDGLPPELVRRFSYGKWFFDLPSEEEVMPLWRLYAGTREAAPTFFEKTWEIGWTGAEIRNCCELAERLDISLEVAAQYIVPFALSDTELVRHTRDKVNGRFLSASTPGPYHPPAATPAPARSISL